MVIVITNKSIYVAKNTDPDPDNIFLIVNYTYLLSTDVIKFYEGRSDGGFLELTVKSPLNSASYSHGSTNLHHNVKKPRYAYLNSTRFYEKVSFFSVFPIFIHSILLN